MSSASCLFNLPSMNTRSCLSAQKRKEGLGSRPVGPDKEEVAMMMMIILLIVKKKQQSNLVFRIRRA